MPSREEREPVERGMRALAPPAGEGIGDDPPVEDGFENVQQGMVNDPVPVGRGRDRAGLGVADPEGPAISRAIRTRFQFLQKFDQMRLQVELERRDVRPSSLSPPGLPVGFEEIREGAKPAPEITRAFHPGERDIRAGDCPLTLALSPEGGEGTAPLSPRSGEREGVRGGISLAPHSPSQGKHQRSSASFSVLRVENPAASPRRSSGRPGYLPDRSG
jgi:hypothetical protein